MKIKKEKITATEKVGNVISIITKYEYLQELLMV